MSLFSATGDLRWTTQFGTPQQDICTGVASTPTGRIVVAGHTLGGMPGFANAGSWDGFVSILNLRGELLQTWQFGTASFDLVFGLALTSSDAIIVVGQTAGDLDGERNHGSSDAFVRKMRTDGKVQFTQLLGTSAEEIATAVDVTRRDGIIVAGYTGGSLPGFRNAGLLDAFVIKLNPFGAVQWSYQLGSAETDRAFGLTVDQTRGDIYVVGATQGQLPGSSDGNVGSLDSFLAMLTSGGALGWTRQFGTTEEERPVDVAIEDPRGDESRIHVAGWTRGSINGSPPLGAEDVFLAQYTRNGRRTAIDQWGTPQRDVALATKFDSLDRELWVVGYTLGRLNGSPNQGGLDAFLTTEAAITGSGCIAPGIPVTHWRGEYWNNRDLSGAPAMVRDDGASHLNFDWGTGGPDGCGLGTDRFSARWTRTVSLGAGRYHFTVRSDDGFRLFIDGARVDFGSETWIIQPPTTYAAEVALTAGDHTIVMEYFEEGGLAVAELSWNLVASGLEWPNLVSAANSDPWLAEHHTEVERMRPRILALNFVNNRGMDEMRKQLKEAIDAIAEGSRYRGYEKKRKAPAFLQYELAYAVDLRDASPVPGYHNSTLYPRENPTEGQWGFDYERLFTPEFTQLYGIPDPSDRSRYLGLCELIDRGLVHEVWVYGEASDVNAAEILELKPFYDENRRRQQGAMNRCAGNGCFDDEDDIPCDRTVRIAWFNHARGPGCFLESFSHGLESMGGGRDPNRISVPYLARYFIPFANFGLDKRYARHNLPFSSWYDVCPDEGSDVLNCLSYRTYRTETSVMYEGSFGGAPVKGTLEGYDPVCGNAHFPPNARGQYDLSSPYSVRSGCTHYRDGTGKTENFTRNDFKFKGDNRLVQDCTGAWQVWWYQNIPGLDNASKDDSGGPMLNWWPFLFY